MFARYISALFALWTAAFLPSISRAQNPLDPFLQPGLDLSGASSLVGATPTTFDRGSNGSATLHVPLTVPPGTAGVGPGLALVYDSQGGNGLVGMGWSLTGLSVIMRCPAQLVPDGFIDPVDYDANDQFCLDGERLVPYGDGSYRTQIDNFTRVVPSGGTPTSPLTFTAYTKEGKILEYGGTGDSRIEAQGRTDVLAWALDRTQDRAGNFYTVIYGKVSSLGFFAPLRIDYTGNSAGGLSPYNSVRFHYEARADAPRAFNQGSFTSTPVRLKQIDAFAGSTPGRSYKLSYEAGTSTDRSRLLSLQECGFQANGIAACFDPTAMGWSEGTKSFLAPTRWLRSNGGPGGSQTSNTAYQLLGDFNGDGRQDYMWYESGGWNVALSSGTGFLPPTRWLAGSDGPDGVATYNSGSNTGFHFAVDMNGDGRTDYLWYQSGWNVALSNGSGFDPATRWLASNGGPGGASTLPSSPAWLLIGDFSGDGRSDLMYYVSGGWHVALSSGTSFLLPIVWLTGTDGPGGVGTYNSGSNTGMQFAVDMNGDGRTDYLWYQSGWNVALSNGSGFDPATRWLASNGGPSGASTLPSSSAWLMIGDFNGDGLADLMYYVSGGWHMALSSGTGFLPPTVWLTGTDGPGGVGTYNSGSNTGMQFAVDMNGDGRSDYLWYQSGWNVTLSNGSGFDPATRWLASNGGPSGASTLPSSSAYVLIGDFNGDSRSDLMYYISGWYMGLQAGEQPDLLVLTADAFGSQKQFDYAPLSDPNYYTKGSGATYPSLDVQSSQYVVSVGSLDDGLGGVTIHAFHYRGLRYDARRRSSLGFEWEDEYDESRGLHTMTWYNQTFPIQGTQSKLELHTADDNLRMRTTSVVTSASNAQSTIFRYFVSQNVDEFFDADGSLAVSRTTNSQVDAYNNPTVVTSSSSDGYAKTTTTTFLNDESNWRIGLPSQAQIAASAPGVPAITRTVSSQFDATTGLPTQEIVQPGTALALTRLFTRDVFGNVTRVTTSGPDIATRAQDATFDAQGRFPISARNALQQTETRSFDARYGTPLQVVDINGQTTTFAYDPLGRETLRTHPDGTQDVTVRAFCPNAAAACASTGVVSVGLLRNGAPPSYRVTDSLGREVRRSTLGFDGRTVHVDTAYDAVGRVAETSLPYFEGDAFGVVQFTHDGLDRVLTRTETDGSVTTFAYSRLTTSAVNELGQTRTETKNSQDKIVEVIDATGHSNHYTYDGFLDLLSVTDPQNHVTSATYDALGRRLTLSDPDLGATITTYDALGEVLTERDAKGQLRSFQYDLLGRPTQRTEADGSSTLVYDTAIHGVGALASVSGTTTGTGYARSLTYDTSGRPSSTTLGVDGHSYTTSTQYDAFGRVSNLTYPSGFAIRNLYNTAGYLARVENAASSAAYWVGEAKNASGQPTQELLGSGLRTRRTFDPLTLRLAQIQTGVGTGSATQNLSYSWNALGSLVQRADANHGHTENFQYDALNRLTQAQVVSQAAVTFSYDSLGNLLTKSDVGAYTYGSSAGPHAVTATTGPLTGSYQYDVNGNQTQRLDAAGLPIGALQYTSFDKPSSITNSSPAGVNAIVFRYDEARSLLLRRDAPAGGEITTTYHAGALFEELVHANGATEQKHYIPGAEAVVAVLSTTGSTSALKFLHRDHLGSVDVITDANGGVLESLSYDAFGKRRNADWSPATAPIGSALTRGFTGHEELDPVGLVHMGGRVYDPTLGRFTSADPFVQFPDSTQGLNRYAYVLNNPLSFTDPSGYSIGSFFKGVGRTITQAIGQVLRNPLQIIAGVVIGCIVLPGAGCFVGGIMAILQSLAVQALKSVAYQIAFRAGQSFVYGNDPPRFLQTSERIAGAFAQASAFRSSSQTIVGIGGDVQVKVPDIFEQWTEVKSGGTIYDVASGDPGLSGAAGSAVKALGTTFLEDISSAFYGLVAGNGLGIIRGFGETLAGLFTFDRSRVGGGIASIVAALIPRYGFYAGPLYSERTIKPLTVIDRAALKHDTEYAQLSGFQRFSSAATDADWRLLENSFADQRLGPIGQVYRLGLSAVFLTKIAVQESIGRIY